MQLAELFTTCEQLQQAGKVDEALLTIKLGLMHQPTPTALWVGSITGLCCSRQEILKRLKAPIGNVWLFNRDFRKR
jgi:hypothetical protein